jgi:hypothetical protein
MFSIVAACAFVVVSGAPAPQMDLPVWVRQFYRNPDGSCVQCSIGLCGADQNVPSAASLLWATEFGPAVRGGSDPMRVARYCRDRNIRIYNITGSQTYEWMKWATRNGRGCAIGAGRAHFQTLYAYDDVARVWTVLNNNWRDDRPAALKAYTDDEFRQLHEASGRWVVILDYPPHPADPRS